VSKKCQMALFLVCRGFLFTAFTAYNARNIRNVGHTWRPCLHIIIYCVLLIGSSTGWHADNSVFFVYQYFPKKILLKDEYSC